MKIITHQINKIKFAEIEDQSTIINSIEAAKDLLGEVYYQGYDGIILHQKNIDPAFFDLKNKMAGHILQKFSTYRIIFIVLGDFKEFTSNSLNDFIWESNKGKMVNFLADIKAVQNRYSN
ncbi:DUF4180 domain-containing protein [Crocinitomix algicola]|uniref:DUF4180 domain-containing protein n=1 Tax=Crocinitomix algicola TaxID=1740263 RepID=UPI0008723954|nr:DUF4180 domain-containing protein [Crocinitomix algicola]